MKECEIKTLLPKSQDTDIKIGLVEDSDITVPDRTAVTNKGDCGKLLIIGGDVGMAGAVCFSALTAYRSGTGLVEIHTNAENRIPVQILVPEAIASFWDGRGSVALGSYSACVIGVGMGRSTQACRTAEYVLSNRHIPVVADADALNIISENPHLLDCCNENTILTPHIAEFSRMIGESTETVLEKPLYFADSFSKKYKTNLILKNDVTVIATADGSRYASASGVSTLSKGGSGDVLSGLLGSFIAQKMPVKEAILSAVYIHGLAGKRAGERFGQHGALAREVADEVAQVIKNLI